MSTRVGMLDDSDVYLIVGIVLCSFDHYGAGLTLVMMGCFSGLINALQATRK